MCYFLQVHVWLHGHVASQIYCTILEHYFVYLQVAMRALGFDVKKADVLKIMKDYDREASGKITFDDFNEVSKYGPHCLTYV